MYNCLLTVILLFLPAVLALGQDQSGLGFGFKGGANFANVSKAESINSENRTGFMVGVFMAPPSQGVLGFRSELVFSRQGYDFQNQTTTGSVKLDYLIMPQLSSINITKYVSILVGGQIAYLVSAQADSSANPAAGTPYAAVLDYYNRIDYGLAGGVEIFPAKNFLIGARYNLSLGNLFKDPTTVQGETPSFVPSFSNVNPKQNVVQLFAGVRF